MMLGCEILRKALTSDICRHYSQVAYFFFNFFIATIYFVSIFCAFSTLPKLPSPSFFIVWYFYMLICQTYLDFKYYKYIILYLYTIHLHYLTYESTQNFLLFNLSFLKFQFFYNIKINFISIMNALGLQQIPNVEIGILSEIQPDQEVSTISTAPLPATILFYTELLAKKLNLNFNRTNHCKHRGSCVCSCLASSTKAGFLSYLIKAGISTVFNIKKILKSPKNIINGFTNKDSIKFGFFICFFLLLFRTLVCFLRRKTEPRNHKFIFLIGGFIGATASAFILEKKTRQAFGLFLIARAIDISYRSLVEKKIIPDYKYFYPVLYGLMMVVTGGLALGHEPASMSPQLHKFYLQFTNQTPSEQQMRRIWIERKNIELGKKGVSPYNALDYLPKARAAYEREVLKKQ